jgi:transposase
VLNLRLIVL